MTKRSKREEIEQGEQHVRDAWLVICFRAYSGLPEHIKAAQRLARQGSVRGHDTLQSECTANEMLRRESLRT